jgi:nucleotide-binding universal stress UspA family protein
MHRSFDKILVPMDLSPISILALEHALYLAKALKSEIHLLHVKETATVNNMISSLFKKNQKDLVKDINIINSTFQKYVDEYKTKHGINVHMKILEGTVYVQVLKYAKEISAGLICMGTHGSKRIESFIGGSNTFRVVNQAKCPVLSTYDQSGTKGIKDIILPIDSSRDTREKVDDAIFIAQQFNSTIHVVGVSTSSDDVMLNRLRVITRQVEEYIQQDKIQTTLGFKTGKNLAHLTLEYSKEKNADLIVMMTEQESGSGFLAGPYSLQMINESNIPILSVRPKDRNTEFVTPY